MQGVFFLDNITYRQVAFFLIKFTSMHSDFYLSNITSLLGTFYLNKAILGLLQPEWMHLFIVVFYV